MFLLLKDFVDVINLEIKRGIITVRNVINLRNLVNSHFWNLFVLIKVFIWEFLFLNFIESWNLVYSFSLCLIMITHWNYICIVVLNYSNRGTLFQNWEFILFSFWVSLGRCLNQYLWSYNFDRGTYVSLIPIILKHHFNL